MTWLRARMHLFAPIALVVALVALGIDWLRGEPTRQETLVYAILAVGGIGFLVLKVAVLKRGRDDEG
ncbi:MAG: hypothetical protein AAGP08_15640 [Pseudomonadota bacterium]